MENQKYIARQLLLDSYDVKPMFKLTVRII